MKINVYNYANPGALQFNVKKKKDCSFGMQYDIGNGLNIIGDGIRYNKGTIKNYTKLIRGVKVFKELPQYLKTTYPNGAKIYDYACSTGHEASSIVISLFNGVSPNDAKKFLPIMAFDSNPKIVKMAERCVIKLIPQELADLRRLGNINMADFLLKVKKTQDGQIAYKMTNKLSENIQFKKGDLFEDLENGNLSKEPCVLFFRNAWQFLTKEGASELASSLFKKLPSKSTIIIGERDIEERSANLILQRVGFKKIKGLTPNDSSNKTFQDKFVSIIEGESLSTFCFKKP